MAELLALWAWRCTDYTLKEKPRILQSKFGDGYAQESPDGLNADLAEWSLSFEDVSLSVLKAMRDFLKARKASEKFIFYTPLGEKITVKCRAWDTKPTKKGRVTLNATFEQVP